MDIELPYDTATGGYAAFIGCGSSLFFFVHNHDIYCLDLLITNKWYKSDKRFPQCFKRLDTYVITTKDNYAHFMRFNAFLYNPYHFRISLYDVIPNELINIYHIYFEWLVYVYIKSEIENKYQMSIPNALKYLIYQFYP